MVRILFFGDFLAKQPDRIVLSSNIQELLSSSDAAICNFEAPIEVDVPPCKKSGPSLSQSPLSPSFLVSNGFNVILLANNHMMDYGERGLVDTCNSFGQSLLVGAGTQEEAYSARILEVNGYRIGFLSAVQHEFGVIDDENKQLMGVAWISHPCIKDIISSIRKDVDYLFVSPHAGVEFIDAPLPEWRCLYKRMIDWGADAIIGSHPHVPQGWEIYNNKYIFYSLGNFYFDILSGNNYWNKSLMVELKIDDSLVFKVHPICFNDGHIDIDLSHDTTDHINYLNSILGDNYSDYITEECTRLLPDYEYSILNSLSGVPLRELGVSQRIKLLAKSVLRKPSTLPLLNIIQCESHRWLLERALKNKEYVNREC